MTDAGTVPGVLAKQVVSALEPEFWHGNTTPAGLSATGSSGGCAWNYDWVEVVQDYLRQDMGRFCALAMSMIAHGGNTEPIILCKTMPSAGRPELYGLRRGIWNGNHRAAVAFALGLPLKYLLVDPSALIEAATTCRSL